MPTVTQHAVGTFCWPECATKDSAATKKFYSELLGWTWKDIPMGDQGTYHIAEVRGSEVAAMYQYTDEMCPGMPPHWASYISVANVDQSVKVAESLGGKLVMGPMDVMDHGRMATIMDPIGATFCLWQANKHCGVGLIGEPGSLGWTQLNATDPGKAKTFYTALLGWKTQEMPSQAGGAYTTWHRDGDDMTGAGGMMPMPPGAGAPSHWLVYWMVADARTAHAKAESLGAKTFVPPTDIPGMLTFTVMADPQGVMFALMSLLMA